jgi:cyclophilin family peptidyl-prolyl cis-trans isomerase
MKTWIIIIIVIVLAAAAAYLVFNRPVGQTPAENSQNNNTKVTDTFDINNKKAVLDTSLGKIEIKFYAADAPKAVENFLRLAEKGYYNGVTFHRVIKDFMIQGGDPTGTGAGGASIWGKEFEDELNPDSVSYKAGYKKGVVAMANRGPNTNGSQFFIMLKDYPLPHQYTIFGEVLSGQDVVDKIGLLPTDAQDRPLEKVTINKATVEPLGN